jgi:hypothetical protein
MENLPLIDVDHFLWVHEELPHRREFWEAIIIESQLCSIKTN